MKNLILLLFVFLVSCQSAYITTTTYTTDSLGNKIKTIKKEYRETNSTNSYIEITPDPFYRYTNPFYYPYYRPYYYRPHYIPYGPRYKERSGHNYKPSVPLQRNQPQRAPIRTFPRQNEHR